jgi:two-component system CheB/CheR fusion protein
LRSDDPLLDAVRKLAFARDVESVTRVVRETARALTAADGMTFVLRDDGQCYYVDEDAIAPLWKGRRFPMDQCISGWVMHHGQPAVIEDIYADDRIPHDAYRPTFVKSLAMVPVRAEAPIAAIGAYWARPHAATPEELAVLQTLADASSLALANVDLYQELQQSLERERRARLAAEDVNRAKDEFLATLSHELRTPLNVIQGWVWTLNQPGVPEDIARRATEALERNVRLQARLIEDLLDISRAIAGKLNLERRVVGLAGLAGVALEAIRPEAEAKGLSLKLNVEEDVPPVWADPDRLQQVLWNVLSNAMKFTPKNGSIEVDVRRGERTVLVTVRDTGVGLDPEFTAEMFKPFRQADSSSTRHFQGLGLGLAIVKRIVDLHGGTVRAASEGPDRGTAITVELPIPPVAEEPAAWLQPAARPRPTASRLDGVSVLLVDDEPDAGEAVRAVLEHHGAQVRLARSAQEALEALGQRTPDVILSDLAMPGMDGCALLSQVRAMAGRVGHVPAAALTAYANGEHAQAASRAGYQRYLAKPVGLAELTSCLAQLARP